MAGPNGNCQTLFIQRQLSYAKHFMHAFTKNMGFIRILFQMKYQNPEIWWMIWNKTKIM